jgi:hypothetical protein
VDSATSFMYRPVAGTGDGLSLPEQFTPVRPDNTSNPIQPGEPMLLQSEQTGLWCRVVVNGGVSKVQCDQPTRGTATPLTYTGVLASVLVPSATVLLPGQAILVLLSE